MEWIVDLLRSHPELAIFLTLALGFWIGKIKVAGFGLGIVTSVLLVGVLVGQLDIPVTGPLKSVFFLLFLFAIGYKVGPQFFRGLRKDGCYAALREALSEEYPLRSVQKPHPLADADDGVGHLHGSDHDRL